MIDGTHYQKTAEAWHAVVAEAFLGERELRDPRAGLVIPKPDAKPEQPSADPRSDTSK